MARSPVGDWQELSALYEEADGLDAAGCAAMLERLRRAGHPQLGALEQMLRARDHVRSDAFMDRLPSLPSLAPPRPGEGTVSPGDHFGPYSLVRRLGLGGMAQVWLAERDDGAFQRHVAIKLPFRHAEGAQRETLVQRFARERDILAALHHPNIAALHDAGVTPAGQPWLALELVEGEAITGWCDRQRLPIRERVRLFRQVLRAVQHAHANLVIHRDLKPANILVTPQGNVRLLDFGIAKLVEPVDGRSADSDLTREGGTPLTLQYASPEQITGLPLTTACDVYALGVVLYELLAGMRPYEPKIDSAAQIEQAIVEQEPRAPSRREATAEVLAARNADARGLRRELAPDLDAIVLHALAKQAQGRYPSVEAFLADLDRWLGGQPVAARRPSAWYWLRKFVARHRIGVALGAGAVASLIGATAVAIVMGIQARQESARAVAARDFVLGTYRMADPELSGGRDLNARQLLNLGRDKAIRELGRQPDLQAEVLRGIGEVQGFLADHVGSAETLSEAAEIYRRQGRFDQAAESVVELAQTAYHLGDGVRAQDLLAEAARLRPPRPGDDAYLARYWWVRAWVGEAQSVDLPVRRDHALRALQHARAAWGEDSRQTIDAIRQLADIERRMRNYPTASALARDVETRILARPGFSTRERLKAQVESAAIDYESGHFESSAARFAAILAECVGALGPSNEECSETRMRRAVVLLVMGDAAAAVPLLPDILAQREDPRSPRRQSEALVIAYRIAAHAGQASAYPQVVADVEALARSGVEVNKPEVVKIQALHALAEGALLRRDAAGALRWLDAAQQRAASVPPPGVPARSIGRIHLLRGIALQLQGEHVGALAALREGEAAYAEAVGADSAFTLLFAMNQVPSLLALGHRADASRLLERGSAVLPRALGARSPYAATLAVWRASTLSTDVAVPAAQPPARFIF